MVAGASVPWCAEYPFLKDNLFQDIPEVMDLPKLERLDIRNNPLADIHMQEIVKWQKKLGPPEIDPEDDRLMDGFAYLPIKNATQ